MGEGVLLARLGFIIRHYAPGRYFMVPFVLVCQQQLALAHRS